MGSLAHSSDVAAGPGRLALRPAPIGLPDADLVPPVIAEAGDPFSTVRVLHLLARIPRGSPVLVDDLVSGLGAEHLGWLFEKTVVIDAILQLQANWMADYRNSSGIVLEDGPYGLELTLEDSSRVDPWLIRQITRQAAACRDALVEFSRRDRLTGGD